MTKGITGNYFGENGQVGHEIPLTPEEQNPKWAEMFPETITPSGYTRANSEEHQGTGHVGTCGIVYR